MNLTESLKMYNEAKLYIPSGVNSNSRYRNPHPIYYKKGKGAYLTDLDNNKYLDIVLGNGAIILGHDNDKFMDKFYNYLNSGIVTGVETDLGIKVAKKFLELVPTAEQVRFSNTGTEAILHAIMMSRTYTGSKMLQ
jgi:glutamate-1-semialdehyde 2,1-aminomutase